MKGYSYPGKSPMKTDPFTPGSGMENFTLREIKSAESEAKLKELTGQARVDAFSKRHDKNYTYGVNTAGTAEQGRGQKMYVDADGNSIEMNERRFLQNI